MRCKYPQKYEWRRTCDAFLIFDNYQALSQSFFKTPSVSPNQTPNAFHPPIGPTQTNLNSNGDQPELPKCVLPCPSILPCSILNLKGPLFSNIAVFLEWFGFNSRWQKHSIFMLWGPFSVAFATRPSPTPLLFGHEVGCHIFQKELHILGRLSTMEWTIWGGHFFHNDPEPAPVNSSMMAKTCLELLDGTAGVLDPPVSDSVRLITQCTALLVWSPTSW